MSERKKDVCVGLLALAIAGGLIIAVAGCSGGVSMSVGAGGSVHNPNHKRLPEVVRETPIIATTTGKSWSLGEMKGEK